MDAKELTRRVAESAKSLRALYHNTNCSPDGFLLAVDGLANDAQKLLAALPSDVAQAPLPAIQGHDLATSVGGCGYLVEYFATRLRTHTYQRYIEERLAKDFACALSKHLSERDNTALPSDAAQAPWISAADRLPVAGKPVLAAFKNVRGHWRTARAHYAPKMELSADDWEDTDDCDEDADGHYFAPEGWYEDPVEIEVSALIPASTPVTHWMPLPPAPDAAPVAPAASATPPREVWLYQHDDDSYAVAVTPEDAAFARGEPAWHRMFPVPIYGLHATVAPATDQVRPDSLPQFSGATVQTTDDAIPSVDAAATAERLQSTPLAAQPDEREALYEIADRIFTTRVDDDEILEFVAALRAPTAPSLTAVAGAVLFQARVQPWMMECFGAEISADRVERNHRFFEEATELVQACGMTASEAHQLVDYTFGRPVGEPHQEVGGVMVTLAALCLANSLDMHAAGETELARISVPETVAKIRAKQAAKPKHSPLPEAAHPTEQRMSDAARDVLAERARQVSEEGRTPALDDRNDLGQMASAAACYAITHRWTRIDVPPPHWPGDWARAWWKPTTPRRDLVKAGALILAEIERLDRAGGNSQ